MWKGVGASPKSVMTDCRGSAQSQIAAGISAGSASAGLVAIGESAC